MLCKFCNVEIEDYFKHANNSKIHSANLIKYYDYIVKYQYQRNGYKN